MRSVVHGTIDSQVVESAREPSLQAVLIAEETCDQGIRDLYRTVEDDGVFRHSCSGNYPCTARLVELDHSFANQDPEAS